MSVFDVLDEFVCPGKQEPYDPDAALQLFQKAAAWTNSQHNKLTGGKGIAWAKENRPELWEACLTVFDAVRAAFQVQDMAALWQATADFVRANERLFAAYAAFYAGTGEPEGEPEAAADGLAEPEALPPEGGQEGNGENITHERGEPPETLFPELEAEGAGGVNTKEPTRKPEEKTSGFVSPWQPWLDAVPFTLVTDLATWRAALEEAWAAGICAIDTETTGLDPLQNRIRLVQLAVPVYPESRRLVSQDGRNPEPGGSAKVFILDLFALPEADRREALEALVELMSDSSVLKIGHNLKFDLSFVRMSVSGTRVPVERVFDTMLASQLCTAGDFIPEVQFENYCLEWLIRAEKQGNEKTRYFDQHNHELFFERDTQKKIRPVYPTHALGQVAHRHLEIQMAKEHQTDDWSGEISPEMLRYAAQDAAVLLPLQEILARLLVMNRLADVAKIEFACLPAVTEIELTGMSFDAPRARELLTAAEAETDKHYQALVQMAREVGFRARPKKSMPKKKYSPDLNPDSGQDCVDCLRLLAEQESVLGKDGKAFVVDDETLDIDSRDETLSRLAARLPEESALRQFATRLRAYRAAKKQSDFLKQWLEKLHPTDERLHPDLRQINPFGVGRFSASNPNLQQVGRGKEVRSLFRAPEGRKLIVADYSGIEMRIMCQLAGDKTMLAAFKNDIDIHRYTAAATTGKKIEEVTKDERQMSKPVNFGLIYGMQSDTLRIYAETGYGVKMSLEEANAAREKFFQTYSAVAQWHRQQDRRAYESGFDNFHRHDALHGYYTEKRPCARTLGGRLRVWPVVEQERRNGEGTYRRKAGAFTELYNTPDQGSGADMVKCAMSRLYRELLRRGLKDVKIIACVHDEIVLEAPEEKAQEAADLLGSVMEYTASRFLPDVPVEAEVAVCETWAEK